MVQQKVLGRLAQLVALPADELGLERVHDGRRRPGHVDQDEAEEARRVGQPEAGQDVGARALAQPDDVLDVQEVQNRDELLAEQLQRRELEAGGGNGGGRVISQLWHRFARGLTFLRDLGHCQRGQERRCG